MIALLKKKIVKIPSDMLKLTKNKLFNILFKYIIRDAHALSVLIDRALKNNAPKPSQ